MDFNSADYQTPPSHFEYVIDKSALDPQRVAKIKTKVADAMQQLHGWCSVSKAFTLVDLILQTQAKTIVEIGVWGGKSLVPMAFAIKELHEGTVYGIDPWSNKASIQGMDDVNKDWWGKVDHTAVYQDLVNKLKKFKLTDYVQLWKCSSENAPAIFDIDLLHIDGNHSEETSMFDTLKWVPLVRSGGLIVFDDITWTVAGYPTTRKAVDWLDEHCTRVAQYKDSCEWGVWLKP